MANSTRDHFYDAISHSPTPLVAAGLVKAMHASWVKELLEQVEELQPNLLDIQEYLTLKKEYTTV
jgi:hypothetical protein